MTRSKELQPPPAHAEDMAATTTRDYSPPDQPPAKRARTNIASGQLSGHRAAARNRTPHLSLVACWSDLPPDLIGTISTFLDVGGDLQSLVVVVGRENAGSVKRAYLRRNARFLQYQVLVRDAATAQFNVRQWMQVNSGWRDMCDRNHMDLGQYDVAVPTTSTGLMMSLAPFRGTTVFTGYRRFPDGKKAPCEEANLIRNVGDAIVAVDGKSTTGKPFMDVLGMVREAAKKKSVKFRFAVPHVHCCFCDPRVAAEFGLLEVLRHLVEERGKDVNHQSTKWLPLLAIAMRHPDPSVFTYLLSVDGIDCNLELLNGMNYGTTRTRTGVRLLHFAAFFSDVEASCLKALIDQKGTNVAAHDSRRCNALHYAADSDQGKIATAKVKILLL